MNSERLTPEQRARIGLMAAGDPTWDLSPNDCAALRSLLEEVERLERELLLRDDHAKMLANWKNVCASDIFQELKHGEYREIMHLLADGQISVGKAAQSIAEWAHSGVKPSLPPHEYASETSDMVSWKDRAEAAESALRAQRVKELPLLAAGQKVHVEHERFRGDGIVQYDMGAHKRWVGVLLENGNTWEYERETVAALPPALAETGED